MYVCEISKNEAKFQAPAYSVSLFGILIIARHSPSCEAIVPTAGLKLHFYLTVFQAHEESHVGIRRKHKCPVCEQCFITNKQLVDHINTHTGNNMGGVMQKGP